MHQDNNSYIFIFIGNIDQAQYCDKIKGIVDFLGTDLSSDELTMIWKMQVSSTSSSLISTPSLSMTRFSLSFFLCPIIFFIQNRN